MKRDILEPYADRFWEARCLAPEIKNFKADIKPKEGAKPSVRRPFKLTPYDNARLVYRLMEYEETGQLDDVDPKDAGESLG